MIATTAAEVSDWTFRMARRPRVAVQVDALSQFTTDWEIITAEDIVYKGNLKCRIQAAVMAAAESISRWQCDEDEDDQDENVDEDVETEATTSASHLPPGPLNAIKNTSMPKQSSEFVPGTLTMRSFGSKNSLIASQTFCSRPLHLISFTITAGSQRLLAIVASPTNST